MNIGKALDPKSGIFKTLKAGLYYFTFSGRKSFDAPDTFVSLKKNETAIAWAQAQILTSGATTMSLHVAVKLQVNDLIYLELLGGNLYDDEQKFTSFTGFLLEEDLKI